jgi:hypothetical protein
MARLLAVVRGPRAPAEGSDDPITPTGGPDAAIDAGPSGDAAPGRRDGLGPRDATHLVVTNRPPDGDVRLVSATRIGCACAVTGQIVICTRPVLRVGAAPSIAIGPGQQHRDPGHHGSA